MLNDDSAIIFKPPKPTMQPNMGEKDPGYLDTIKAPSTVVLGPLFSTIGLV
jgi:hypothetical protein